MARDRKSGGTDTTPTTRSDAYVGLLVIALLAQITGAVFFYLDWQQYPTRAPQEPPRVTFPNTAAPIQAGGAQGGGVQGGAAGGAMGARGGGAMGAGGGVMGK